MPAPGEQPELVPALAAIESWLRVERPANHAVLQPGQSGVALAAAELQMGARLPEALRTLYGWRDGQEDSGQTGLIGTTWLLTLSELWYRRRELHLDPFPFAADGGGKLLCVEVPTGSVVSRAADGGAPQGVAPTVAHLLYAVAEGFGQEVIVERRGDWRVGDAVAWGVICRRYEVVDPF